jgi:hypothetical protein
MNLESWTWSLLLIAVTITIHAGGVALLSFGHLAVRVRLGQKNRLAPQVFAAAIGLIGSAGLFLALLHAIEAALWAARIGGSAR